MLTVPSDMKDTEPSPSSPPSGTGSLWATPQPAHERSLDLAPVDPSVSASEIRAAVEAERERVASFSGRVPEKVLQAPIK